MQQVTSQNFFLNSTIPSHWDVGSFIPSVCIYYLEKLISTLQAN